MTGQADDAILDAPALELFDASIDAREQAIGNLMVEAPLSDSLFSGLTENLRLRQQSAYD